MTALNYELVSAYDWEFVLGVLRRLDWRKLAEDNQYSGEPLQTGCRSDLRRHADGVPRGAPAHRPEDNLAQLRPGAAAKRLGAILELLTDHPELRRPSSRRARSLDFRRGARQDLDLTPANRIR